MTAPAFHLHDPAAPLALFACTACQRPVGYVLHTLFGVKTLTCLCRSCGAALLQKWPDAGDVKGIGP